MFDWFWFQLTLSYSYIAAIILGTITISITAVTALKINSRGLIQEENYLVSHTKMVKKHTRKGLSEVLLWSPEKKVLVEKRSKLVNLKAGFKRFQPARFVESIEIEIPNNYILEIRLLIRLFTLVELSPSEPWAQELLDAIMKENPDLQPFFDQIKSWIEQEKALLDQFWQKAFISPENQSVIPTVDIETGGLGLRYDLPEFLVRHQNLIVNQAYRELNKKMLEMGFDRISILRILYSLNLPTEALSFLINNPNMLFSFFDKILPDVLKKNRKNLIDDPLFEIFGSDDKDQMKTFFKLIKNNELMLTLNKAFNKYSESNFGQVVTRDLWAQGAWTSGFEGTDVGFEPLETASDTAPANTPTESSQLIDEEAGPSEPSSSNLDPSTSDFVLSEYVSDLSSFDPLLRDFLNTADIQELEDFLERHPECDQAVYYTIQNRINFLNWCKRDITTESTGELSRYFNARPRFLRPQSSISPVEQGVQQGESSNSAFGNNENTQPGSPSQSSTDGPTLEPDSPRSGTADKWPKDK